MQRSELAERRMAASRATYDPMTRELVDQGTLLAGKLRTVADSARKVLIGRVVILQVGQLRAGLEGRRAVIASVAPCDRHGLVALLRVPRLDGDGCLDQRDACMRSYLPVAELCFAAGEGA